MFAPVAYKKQSIPDRQGTVPLYRRLGSTDCSVLAFLQSMCKLPPVFTAGINNFFTLRQTLLPIKTKNAKRKRIS